MNLWRLYFAAGDFGENPDAVTHLLGFAPTRVVLRGDLRPGVNNSPAPRELWAFDSPLDGKEPFEAHLEAILTQLEMNPTGVREAAERFGAVLQCASHHESINPAFALSADHVRRLAWLGIGVDFDLYVFGPESDNPTAVPASG
jgi:hypothetical protein